MVLLRHGQSAGNLEDRFTGWDDDDLTGDGREEARRAGRLLEEAGLSFASCLKRAIRTLWIVLDEMWTSCGSPRATPGALTSATTGPCRAWARATRYGEEAVGRWQRGYSARPPAVGADDPRHPGNDPRYARLRPEELPPSESLEDVLARLLPHWSGVVAPAVEAGGRALVEWRTATP